ncbi:cation diffusion facilitator family transporter [Paenibacillus chondroitinus]|uniref:Cation diffusion facilitator family transporter n=1 Tax=Paenibacillus chondroitinus TaxID=59842 RepID=A0ABU6DEA0_9BACL|nr:MULTISPECIES: cation diffusion facilitator family transporter [Paenibacillus]MCY9662125.1 cation diffusion facilitator family transporter [Paenibacillus anseongense]MEB4795637.1 cation diffusion facilitator family transporter [Paenibacillus chondroitinus]
MTVDNKSSVLAIWLSLISNIFLTLMKIIIGLWFQSEVLLADGLHNAGDIIATIAALSAMRISKLPADEDHPYGHGKAEVLGSGFVAFILLIAALYIGYHSTIALFHEPQSPSWVAFTAAVISTVWKFVLYKYTMRIGVNTSSKGLIATAKDHLADVYASLAAVVGIGLAFVGGAYNIAWLSFGDAAAGIIVSLLVLRLAVEMGKESFDILMEKTVDQEKLHQYILLIEAVPEVKRIDRIRAREHGHYILVDARVSIPGELTVQEGHDITRVIKKSIMDQHADVDEVLIHLNPWYED